MTVIEFYISDQPKHIAVLDGSTVPRKGDWISIRGQRYMVVRVTWAVDYADLVPGAALRACVILVRKKD